MTMHRRALIGALGLGAAGAAAATAQAQEPGPPPSDLAARIRARAEENRFRVEFDGSRFGGRGYDELLTEGRAAQFFLIGEEHGVAENPQLAAQLFSDLAFERACVEISPPLAFELDRAARGGVDGVRQMYADPGARAAFFGMREEAEWIAAARAAAPARGQAIWGLDYEVSGDRRIIQRLKAKRKPARAATALAALEAASNEAWSQYAQTHSPQYIFSFSGDPALARAVQFEWQDADAEAAWMLETLTETLTINRYWVEGQGWLSNHARARFNRSNLRRYFASASERERKVMFKFGASHMVRGLSHTHVYDIGNQVSELAETCGEQSFHVMVLPGATSQQAQFDPTAWTYRPGPADAGAYQGLGMGLLAGAAYADAFTLIDLRPIRPLVFGGEHKALDADLVRTIHGFDALLVMSGSTPSSNL